MAGNVLKRIGQGVLSFASGVPVVDMETAAAKRDILQAQASASELRVAKARAEAEGDIKRAQELQRMLDTISGAGQTVEQRSNRKLSPGEYGELGEKSPITEHRPLADVVVNPAISAGDAFLRQGESPAQLSTVPVQEGNEAVTLQQQGNQPGVVPTQDEREAAMVSSPAMAEFALRFPSEFKIVSNTLGLHSQMQKDQAADFANQFRNTPFEQRDALVAKRVQFLDANQRDSTHTREMFGMSEEAGNRAAMVAEVAALSNSKRLELANQSPESFTNVRDVEGGGLGGVRDGQFSQIPGSEIALPGKSGVTINTGKVEPTAEEITQRKAAEARGTEAVNLRGEIRTAAKSARSQINQVRRFRQLSTNTKTGFFAPTINNLRAIGNGLGIEVDEQALASGEGLRALAVPFTLQIAQETKGPISDREMALFATAVPGLDRSALGNEFILEGMQRISQRQIDIDRLATEYVRENGILDVGWDAFVSDWETQNPLFDDGETQLLQNAIGNQNKELGLSGPVETDTGGVIDMGNGVTLQVVN